MKGNFEYCEYSKRLLPAQHPRPVRELWVLSIVRIVRSTRHSTWIEVTCCGAGKGTRRCSQKLAHAARAADLIAPKGRFVGSIENHMLPIGDQMEGKGFGLQLDSNE